MSLNTVTSRRTRSVILAVILVVAVGVVAGFLAVRSYQAARPIKGGKDTTGTVISVADGSRSSRARIAFTAADGERITFSGPVLLISRPSVGDHVAVSYNAGNPLDAHDVNIAASNWLIPGIFGLIFLLSGVGLALLAAYRRRALSS
jgi:Protein of unknown function (DUF3592)